MVVHRLFVLTSTMIVESKSTRLATSFPVFSLFPGTPVRSVAGLLNTISVPCVYSLLGHAQARDG